MTSTLNVNLKPCDCDRVASFHATHSIVEHGATCSARPILIPCPIPRSVTFEVALGECDCPLSPKYIQGSKGFPYPRSFGPDRGHVLDCPARPIRVTCSIGGETWADSDLQPDDHDGRPDIRSACRECWALVKALVLRNDLELARPALDSPKLVGLMQQRDAVFAALADMARAEEALWLAVGCLPGTVAAAVCHRETDDTRHCETALAAYVSHLISRVGAL